MKKNYRLMIGTGTIAVGLVSLYFAISIVSALIFLVSIPSGISLILYTLT